MGKTYVSLLLPLSAFDCHFFKTFSVILTQAVPESGREAEEHSN